MDSYIHLTLEFTNKSPSSLFKDYCLTRTQQMDSHVISKGIQVF